MVIFVNEQGKVLEQGGKEGATEGGMEGGRGERGILSYVIKWPLFG